ncbi:MAG: thiamine phosphate synthase, partial [Desulfitobacteriaceae bacterium]|nr:thiamine phosphate synthase [Desulfitobacteriaceae bacterium]
ADGVHVGQSDMNANDVRALIGPDKILGVSAQTVEQAVMAEKSGADYLGVGAVFSTSTKLDADQVSFETIKRICSSVSIPVVAIGGIDQNNISELKGSGIAGVAVVSAIFAKPDVAKATADLYTLAKGLFA